MLSESYKLSQSGLKPCGSLRLDSQMESDDKSQSEYLSEDYFFVPANDIDADSIAIRIINEDRLSQCQFANPESIASRSNAHPSIKMYASGQGEGGSEVYLGIGGGRGRDQENRLSIEPRRQSSEMQDSNQRGFHGNKGATMVEHNLSKIKESVSNVHN